MINQTKRTTKLVREMRAIGASTGEIARALNIDERDLSL